MENAAVTLNFQNEWITKKMRAILLWVILFGLEFDIRLGGPVTMRKISFLLLITYIVLRRGVKRITTIERSTLVFHVGIVLLGAYVFVICRLHADSLTFVGNHSLPTVQLFYQYLFLIPLPLLLSLIFHSAEEYCGIQLGVLTVQALVAVIGRISKPFRVFVFLRTAYGDGRMLDGVNSGIRVAIIGDVGASASWILFSGCILCTFFLLKKNGEKVRYLLLYGLFLVSMVFVGRTGLYFGVALLALLMFYFASHSPKMMLRIAGLTLLLLALILLYMAFAADGYLKQTTIRWVGEIFVKGFEEGSTAEALRNMPIPPLTGETFWGTGIIAGTTASGVIVAHDSGYIQTYTAWGIVGSVVYYGLFFGYFANRTRKIQDQDLKRVLLLYLVFIMLAEYKEPFLRKTPIMMICMTAIFTQLRNERKDRLQHGTNNAAGVGHLSVL